MTHQFTIKRLLKSNIEEIFEVLKDEEKLSKVLGQSIIEPKVGGKIKLFDGWVKGMILSFKSNELISFTWKPSEWNDEINYSIVEMKFTQKAKYAEIELSHSELPTKKDADSHKDGWEEFFFTPLEDYLNQK